MAQKYVYIDKSDKSTLWNWTNITTIRISQTPYSSSGISILHKMHLPKAISCLLGLLDTIWNTTYFPVSIHSNRKNHVQIHFIWDSSNVAISYVFAWLNPMDLRRAPFSGPATATLRDATQCTECWSIGTGGPGLDRFVESLAGDQRSKKVPTGECVSVCVFSHCICMIYI